MAKNLSQTASEIIGTFTESAESRPSRCYAASAESDSKAHGLQAASHVSKTHILWRTISKDAIPDPNMVDVYKLAIQRVLAPTETEWNLESSLVEMLRLFGRCRVDDTIKSRLVAGPYSMSEDNLPPITEDDLMRDADDPRSQELGIVDMDSCVQHLAGWAEADSMVCLIIHTAGKKVNATNLAYIERRFKALLGTVGSSISAKSKLCTIYKPSMWQALYDTWNKNKQLSYMAFQMIIGLSKSNDTSPLKTQATITLNNLAYSGSTHLKCIHEEIVSRRPKMLKHPGLQKDVIRYITWQNKHCSNRSDAYARFYLSQADMNEISPRMIPMLSAVAIELKKSGPESLTFKNYNVGNLAESISAEVESIVAEITKDDKASEEEETRNFFETIMQEMGITEEDMEKVRAAGKGKGSC